MDDLLLSKQGFAIMRIAQALLEIRPGQRIEPVQEQATRHGTSVGTIQAALDQLQLSGATQIEARGRLGSYATALNYPQLWGIARRRALIGALPLPYARRIEGLATGFRQQFSQSALDLSLRFMRGSAQRMQALSAGEYDWAVVSRFAAETAASHGFTMEIVALLGSQSYMTGHVVVMRGDQPRLTEDNGLRPGMRVGIDLRSMDHSYSVRSIVRGLRVILVPIEYHQGLQLVREGTIDATIWSRADQPDAIAARGMAEVDLVLGMSPGRESALGDGVK